MALCASSPHPPRRSSAFLHGLDPLRLLAESSRNQRPDLTHHLIRSVDDEAHVCFGSESERPGWRRPTLLNDFLRAEQRPFMIESPSPDLLQRPCRDAEQASIVFRPKNFCRHSAASIQATPLHCQGPLSTLR